MALSYFARMQQEERRAELEARRLSDYASEAARKVQRLSDAQLRQAAALASHQGELGHVGRAAEYELRRRNRGH